MACPLSSWVSVGVRVARTISGYSFAKRYWGYGTANNTPRTLLSRKHAKDDVFVELLDQGVCNVEFFLSLYESEVREVAHATQIVTCPSIFPFFFLVLGGVG